MNEIRFFLFLFFLSQLMSFSEPSFAQNASQNLSIEGLCKVELYYSEQGKPGNTYERFSGLLQKGKLITAGHALYLWYRSINETSFDVSDLTFTCTGYAPFKVAYKSTQAFVPPRFFHDDPRFIRDDLIKHVDSEKDLGVIQISSLAPEFFWPRIKSYYASPEIIFPDANLYSRALAVGELFLAAPDLGTNDYRRVRIDTRISDLACTVHPSDMNLFGYRTEVVGQVASGDSGSPIFSRMQLNSTDVLVFMGVHIVGRPKSNCASFARFDYNINFMRSFFP